MSIKKAVDNQRVGFVMVDATDFATPETGLTITGKVRKDGGASATISNTISELTGVSMWCSLIIVKLMLI